MSPRVPVVHSVAVYDGRNYLGDVAEMGNGQFAAFDPEARRLGVFDHRSDAERCVLSRRPSKVVVDVDHHGRADARPRQDVDEVADG